LKEQQRQAEIISEQQKEIHHLKQSLEQQEQEIKVLRSRQSAEQQSNYQTPTSVTISCTDRSLTGGIWNRLYRFIDPRDSKPN